MPHLEVNTNWSLDGTLEHLKYSNNHNVSFTQDLSLPMSSAPEFNGDPEKVNPEQALAAALSSCHMMTFLALAAKASWPIVTYKDRSVASLAKMADGRYKIGAIALHPEVTCSNGVRIKPDELRKMHDRAHKYCFVANSLDLEMTVNVVDEH